MHPAYVAARCARSKAPYLIRFRQKGGVWVFENATAIPERSVSGGDAVNLSGGFQQGPSYPGCAHCKAAWGFYLCGRCQKINCWNQQDQHVTCAWCNNSGTLGGELTRISGSSG